MDIRLEIPDVEDNRKINFVYEVIYPDQLDLKPVLKRGRPRKSENETKTEVVKETTKPIGSVSRTRSGRQVKVPKHIEKYLEEGELNSKTARPSETKPSRVNHCNNVKVEKSVCTNKLSETNCYRRRVSAQYRCPKCKKSYLGKTKMIQHLKKYPDHGPIPEYENNLNFEVWNYLVDITQKCPPSRRGIKFCEELTNLLHNVLLLTSALFKKSDLNKNHIEVDKVLGNAIGLSPGFYNFNDSELSKDVTVLKLITNTDFFIPVEKDHSSTMKPTQYDTDIAQKTSRDLNGVQVGLDYDKTKAGEHKSNAEDLLHQNGGISEQSMEQATHMNIVLPSLESNCETSNILTETVSIKTQDSSIPVLEQHGKTGTDEDATVHNDLLNENSLLNLPNLRNSVDDLLLPNVETSGTLLDNSASSDEVMNVDQFVNERFKNLTDPDIDHTLNLELSGLDLFQFHTT